jgi:hypothetical protein
MTEASDPTRQGHYGANTEVAMHRTHHAQTTWRTMRYNRHGRAWGERDREAVFRIVKNRTFLPKAPGTDLRRSEKCLAIMIGRSSHALFRSGVSS